METTGVSPTTVAIYAHRVGGLLRHAKCESDNLESVVKVVGESDVKAYIQQLPTASQPVMNSAWGRFLDFATSEGVALPDPRSDRSRAYGRSDSTPLTLHPEASAVWDLFRRHPSLDPALVMALQWRHVVFQGGSSPHQALTAEIRDEETPYVFRAPMTALGRLWDFARGSLARPLPEQPLVARGVGSSEAATPQEILRIVKAGKAGLVPRIVEERAARGGASSKPPTPPPPPPPQLFPPKGVEEEG